MALDLFVLKNSIEYMHNSSYFDTVLLRLHTNNIPACMCTCSKSHLYSNFAYPFTKTDCRVRKLSPLLILFLSNQTWPQPHPCNIVSLERDKCLKCRSITWVTFILREEALSNSCSERHFQLEGHHQYVIASFWFLPLLQNDKSVSQSRFLVSQYIKCLDPLTSSLGANSFL